MTTLVTKKVNNNTIDAFIGEGWENWARFKIKYGKHNEPNELFQIKGIRLPKEDYAALYAKYKWFLLLQLESLLFYYLI